MDISSVYKPLRVRQSAHNSDEKVVSDVQQRPYITPSFVDNLKSEAAPTDVIL